ncbi:hypothetical protein F5Y04DRAFT_276632 [Hypomontagnella monticulosa]|nr:hypothetical protein F5Y04DRAFT_276632 [Hypomontagnella monticulosa]
MSGAGYVSMPTLASPEFQGIGELPNSLEQGGELRPSEVPQAMYSMMKIRLQVASTNLYRGRYVEAKEVLDAIRHDVERMPQTTSREKRRKAELKSDTRQLRASYLWLTAQWRKALTEYQKILRSSEFQHDGSLFWVHRDMGLIYANLGDYRKARECIETALRQVGTARTTQKGIVRSAEAVIYLLSGKYRIALATAAESVSIMKETLGPGHFSILAVETVMAWCLVHEGRFTVIGPPAAVAPKFMNTAERLASSLGHQHPVALESMECLVQIYICQARISEAIGTGTSLCTNATRALGESHPSTISMKCQLGAAYLAHGSYRRSVSVLTAVFDRARQVLGHDHPETLKYSCELARAYLHYGNIEEAFRFASKALSAQIDMYMDTSTARRRLTSRSGSIVVENLVDWLEAHANSQKSRIHPYLISSLQVLAQIEYQRHQNRGHGRSLVLSQRLLTLLKGLFSSGRHWSIVDASIVFDLAIAFQEDRASESINLLEEVVKARRRLFGEDHLDTLHAYRELEKTKYMRGLFSMEEGEAKYTELGRFTYTLGNVRRSLDLIYGPIHPETLSARLWHLIMVVGLEDLDNARENEARSIAQLLSDPSLLSERPVESISMQKTLKGLLVSYNSPLAPGLTNSIQKQIEDVVGDPMGAGLRRRLNRLRSMFNGA